MKSKLWRNTFVLLCVFGTIVCWAAEPSSKQMTISAQGPHAANGRYEIVQSPAGMRLTFLLDKRLGRVWQWVEAADGSNAWESMTVENPSIDESSRETENRFQIFVSSAARSTFLLDTKSGQSWQLETATDGQGHQEDIWNGLPRG